ETLGATNVIFTDKTGTLTENLMTVTHFSLDCGDVRVEAMARNHHFFTIDGTPRDPLECKPLREALEVGVLCNNASLPHTEVESTKATGDPLEVALLSAAAKAGIHRETFIESTPEVREEAFDSDAKMMATFHRSGNDYRVAVKGAPESVLEVSSRILGERGEKELGEEERERWKQQNELLASQGLRVLALATRKTDRPEESPYRDLTFLGLVGLADPPRKDVEAAVTSCRNGGIRVIMATGDQPVTARNVALAVGLLDKDEPRVIHGKDLEQAEGLSETSRLRLLRATVFARVSPKQKLDLITIHQKAGSIVAMTGDGVNDAPALKKADIGIAMGQRGTQVAREAADMVLKDDAFSTIVEAIRQGRIIFDNIRKFVLYLISCNISEVMIISLAAAVNAPLPILPLQILFLNFVTDVFPALALGLGEGDQGIMSRLPRDPGEPILSRVHWLAAAGYGLLITISVLSAFAVAFRLLDMEPNQAVTISFLTLAFAQLWHVFNMRERGSSFFRNDVLRNPFVWGALVLCTGFLVAAVYVPGLSTVLKVVHPGRNGWILVLTMSAIPWVCGQILKEIRSGK
ncbi:ATPase, partial [candidate division TA06 bacterium DG_26]